MDLAGGETALVAAEIQGELRDLFGLAEAAHGLARGEGLAGGFVVARLFQALVQRRGLDSARADGVAADAVADEIGGDGLGHADHGGLGDAVVEAALHALDGAGDRRHVDDRAAARLQHIRQNSADHAVLRGHVQVERELPLILVAIENSAGMDDAGAIIKHVYFGKFGSDGLDRLGTGNIEHACYGTFKPGQGLGIDVGGNNCGAFLQEEFGRGATNALSGGGDQSGLAG